MNELLRWLFYTVIIRPLILIVIGLNVRHGDRLPRKGPAIIAANHNSHLDTMVLITLFPSSMLSDINPVAAADYFLRNPLLAWFATRIIGILPVSRNNKSGKHPLEPAFHAMEENRILIIFPEGSRGSPEEMQTFKRGIAHLASKYPDVPVYPVFMSGLGKALPKGEALLVPFFCDVFIGEPLFGISGRDEFMSQLNSGFDALKADTNPQPWV